MDATRRTPTWMLRALPLPRTLQPPRPPRWLTVVLAVVAAGGAGFMVLRDSSLVAVEDVTITGLSGPEAETLRDRLTHAARDMTTLHVREEQLRAVVEPFPVVKSIAVSADPPHRLRITVTENVPVAALGSRHLAADGTVLPAHEERDLPEILVKSGADPAAKALVATLAAAPADLRAKVESAKPGPTLQIADGPELRFGSTDRLAAKWAAVSRVLADPSSQGATYLDVRWPERVAAGGLEDPAAQSLEP